MKKALKLDDQILKLKSRGMIFQDEEKAKEILLDVGYYRLGFYSFPFEKTFPALDNRTHELVDNTSFESVVQLYYFDNDLRRILLAALTRIEVNICTRITYYCSTFYEDNPYWFVDPQIVNSQYIQKFDSKVYKTIKDAPMIKRHHIKYPNNQYAPAWKTLEFMTLGNIVSLYQSLLDHNLQQFIAKKYGCGIGIFINYLETIRVIRNICAHGACLYNISLAKGIKNGPAGQIAGTDRHSINGAIKIISYLLRCVSENRADDMKNNLNALFSIHRNRDTARIIRFCTNFHL